MPSDTRLRVGLVGAGYISEFHARAIQRVPNARIVGIADVVNSRATALAASLQYPESLSNDGSHDGRGSRRNSYPHSSQTLTHHWR